MAAAVKPETAEEVDWHAEVDRCSKMYSIDKWMEPRSMVQVQLAKLKEETRCPMCFGYIRSARISMVCLHRYCAKCIEQYLRAKVPGRHGDDKECPVCRAHLHSRRATKPDHAFDKIIKALYGDVDQYDAEEEALIAQDNKAHIAAWQAQLADMKARQAVAVAAAKAGNLPRNNSSSQLVMDSEHPAAAGPNGSSWPGQIVDAAAGMGSRKRSLGDVQQLQQSGRDGKMARTAADGSTAGARTAGLSRAASQQQHSRVKQEEDDDGGAALLLASLARDRAGTASKTAGASGGRGSYQLHSRSSGKLSSPASMQPAGSNSLSAAAAGSKKKRQSARDIAARLLGVAARAAAAAPQPSRCCLVHLVPANKQQRGAKAPAAAEGRQGRGRKQPSQLAQQHAQRLQQQWQEGEQRFTAPDVDQPYLTCAMDVTVRCLKELLLQQLRQQEASEWSGSSLQGVQLLMAKADAAAAGSSSSAGSVSSVLGDALTVGQLYEQWWDVGPEMQLLYRLLVK